MAHYQALGQIILALVIWTAALVGVSWGWEPFSTWLFHFAWWPLLLFLDGLLIRLQGHSVLFNGPGRLLRWCGWSVTIWLVFEAFNLILHNWRYVGLVPDWRLRWPGYVLAFATVGPGILLAARVLQALGAWRSAQGRPRYLGTWQPPVLLAGVALLILPLIQPKYAFPLIWVAPILLLDPCCELLGGPSLIARWLAGERREHLCLVTAGLLCGVWWELWNYPAVAKWVYSLPILNFGKIFEMPALGYLGFLPFALEVAVLYNFFQALDDRVLTTTRARRLAWMLQGAFWILMFWAIDTWTVISFRG